mmetsp:Transcript_29829/g.53052  ORF Transcript_29829/g.53052 Transcript_29829/m.53052 type:complete len:129 (-) Transcript_29829:16-402(-)
MKTFETIVKDKKRKLIERIKLKKEHSKLEVPEVPDKLKEIVGEFTGGERKRGNSRRKPFKYAKELKEKEVFEADRAAKAVERVDKNQKKKLNRKQRCKAAMMLNQRNERGQPNLKNAMKILYSKIKHG